MVQLGSVAGVAPDVEDMTIQLDDFKAALEEVPPAFGVSENELQQCVQNHVLNFDDRVQVSGYYTCNFYNPSPH